MVPPKEKAIELTRRFTRIESFHTHERIVFMPLPEAKQCALIAVDEILIIQQGYAGNRDEFKTYLNYWQEVKQEIEAL